MQEILIDLRSFKFNGNILDISLPGHSIISEIISSNAEVDKGDNIEVEKDFMVWGQDEIACDIFQYDEVIAFFSLNRIWSKGLNKMLKDIKKALKYGGRIAVWDLYPNSHNIFQRYAVKAKIVDDRIVSMPYKLYYRPFGVNFKNLVLSLEKNNFEIMSSKICGNYYYVEAVSKKEGEEFTNEDTSCST